MKLANKKGADAAKKKLASAKKIKEKFIQLLALLSFLFSTFLDAILSLIGCFVYGARYIYKEYILRIVEVLKKLPGETERGMRIIWDRIREWAREVQTTFKSTWRQNFKTLAEVEESILAFLADLETGIINLFNLIIKFTFWAIRKIIKIIIISCAIICTIVTGVISTLFNLVLNFFKFLVRHQEIILVICSIGILVLCNMNLNKLNQTEEEGSTSSLQPLFVTYNDAVVTREQLETFSTGVNTLIQAPILDQYGFQIGMQFPNLRFRGLSIITNPILVRVYCSDDGLYKTRNLELEHELKKYYISLAEYIIKAGFTGREYMVQLEGRDSEVILAQISKGEVIYSIHDEQENTWGFISE